MPIVLDKEHYSAVAKELRLRMKLSVLKMKNRPVTGNEIMHAASVGYQEAIEDVAVRLGSIYAGVDPDFSFEKFMDLVYAETQPSNQVQVCEA